MTPLDQFRASVALGVLEENDTAEWMRVFRRGFGPEEVEAIETLIEIVSRMAAEAATPASDSANGPEQSGVGVAAPYKEV